MLAHWTDHLDRHILHGRSWGVLGGGTGPSADGPGNLRNSVATFWEAFYLKNKWEQEASYLRQAETTCGFFILFTMCVVAFSGSDCWMRTQTLTHGTPVRGFFSGCAPEGFLGKQVHTAFISLCLQNMAEIKPGTIDSIIFHTGSQNSSEWTHRKNLNWEDRSYTRNL